MSAYQLIERAAVFAEKTAAALPVHAVTPADLEAGSLPPAILEWAAQSGFKAAAGAFLPVPAEGGGLGGALFGLGAAAAEFPFAAGRLAKLLPAGDWRIETTAIDCERLALGFGLGAYSFDRYKASTENGVRMVLPLGVDAAAVGRQLAAVYLVRDLINTPANDLGPAKLEAVFRALAGHYGAAVTAVVGDALLEANFPLVHAVGRAGAEAPRLLEMRWGRPGGRKLTLVGKGVCFDTGGLDIKTSTGMALMKKDMGGAAHVLGLALMVMDAGLDVDLRVIVPMVENAIAGNAFRPGDIYRSRKGLTVQIDNTDAEGRLVLADALALADEDQPELLIDMATLTGAARVALGPDLPPFFTDDEELAAGIARAALETADPLWRMPLWNGYDKDLAARIADLTNAPSGGMAGAITAALFLRRFVSSARSWAHFDVYGWAPADRPHGPAGGEAQAIRALYRLVCDRFA